MKDIPKIMTSNEVHRVIKIGDLVSLRVELDAGLNSSLSNQFSWTLLLLAAMEGTVIGELLVSSGAELDTINDFGETALSLAANPERCGAMITGGGDPGVYSRTRGPRMTGDSLN
jgi:hypothetical protein